MKKYATIIFLSLIIILGFLVRVWNIQNNPYGFFTDEASIGYNAYSLLKTGKDEWGVRLPVLFKASGAYSNPVFIYSAIPIIFLFGLNEFSVRFTSVLYGILGIFALFLLTNLLFGKKIALFSALFLAISPWHIHMSRIGFEVISSVFWVLFSFYLLFKSKQNFAHYPLALVSLIITFLSYYPMRIYTPIFYSLFFLVYYKDTFFWLKNKKFWFYNFAALGIFIVLLWPYLSDGSFFERWKQAKMGDISIDKIVVGYLNHFSADFLFRKGDIDFFGQSVTRHSIRGTGELYWYQLPFIIIGIFTIFKIKKKRREIFFFFLFLLVYPLGSMFTSTAPQATRSVIGVIPFQVLTGIGVSRFLDHFKNHYFRALLFAGSVFIISVSFIHFFNLLRQYPNYSSDYWGWQYGPREVVEYFLKEHNNYDELYLTGYFNAPYIFLKFYDPENKCQNCFILDTDRISTKKRQIFALRQGDVDNEIKRKYPILNFKKIKTIYLPDGSPEIFIGYFF
ncbi:glycosyltransferase family 39 protein [Candidatus Roizmanbacteria bacterium]|nr:glycosyltransferase family 39 protein [Candidatus Roizmanbacteria bacterium]